MADSYKTWPLETPYDFATMKQKSSAGLVTLYSIVFTLLAAAMGSAEPAPDQARGSDPWQPIRGLLGSWEGDAKGEPGLGKCERE